MQRIFRSAFPWFAPVIGTTLMALVACNNTTGNMMTVNLSQPIAGTAAIVASGPLSAGASGTANAGALAPSVGTPPAMTSQPLSAGASAAPPTTAQPATTPQPSPAGINNAGSGGSAAAAPTAGQPAAPMPAATVVITIPSVAPGAEDTRCIHLRLPGSAPLNVVKLHTVLSDGSHHFILTAVNDPSVTETPLERCTGFGGSVTGAPLSITQRHDDYVQLPDGVGYHLNAGHLLRLELHYINTRDHAIDISATTELFAALPGAPIQEGAVMLIGTADFTIPAHSTKDSGPKFLTLPAGMEDVKFYAITGHTHRFGTNVAVSLASGLTSPIMPLYAPTHFDWESPETVQLSPHLTVPKGNGFLLQCAWNNTSSTSIMWGESATDEMCFFWGYYYPRKDVFSIVVDNIDQNLLKKVAGAAPSP